MSRGDNRASSVRLSPDELAMVRALAAVNGLSVNAQMKALVVAGLVAGMAAGMAAH